MSVQDEDGGTAEEVKAPSEIEELASGMGWAPENEWRGDAAKWVDAKQYIKSGPEILKASLRRQDGELTEVRDSLKEFSEHHKKVEQRAYDRAKSDLESKQREAVKEGDEQAFERATEDIKALEAPVEATEAANPDLDPDFIRFAARNDWYGADGDYEMTIEADKAAPIIAQKYKGAEFYTKIEAAMKKKFPDNFAPDPRQQAARVDSGGERAPRKTGKGYGDLPADAKAACDKFVKQGLMTQDAYLKEFDWD